MAIPSTPYLGANSVIAWQREVTRGTAPSTASAWRELGRLSEFQTPGPINAIFKDEVIGAGEEPHEVGFEGRSYGPTPLGPFQVRDPLILGYVFSKETSRAQIGATGFYRHVLEPTDEGQLDSFSMGMRARKLDGSGDDDSVIFLETITPRTSVRFEEPGPDGAAGRLLAAVDVMPHSFTRTNADNVTVNLQTTEPYRFHHGQITLDSTVVGRVSSGELSTDRRARYAYYWRDDQGRDPTEAPPEGSDAKLNLNIAWDEQQLSAKDVVAHLEDRTKFNGTLRFARTVDQDEFRYELTDIAIADARRRHARGKIMMNVRAEVRSVDMSYVDQNNSAHFTT